MSARKPCTQNVTSWPLGENCACGHTGMAHPGSHNPSVKACLLCELEFQIRQIRKARKALK